MIDKLEVRGDRVIVKQLKFADKVGSLYVPESVISRKSKRRADSWKAEVVGIGDKVYFGENHHKFEKGSIVYCAPVALDCPSFEDNEGNRYLVILQEDLLAVEEK